MWKPASMRAYLRPHWTHLLVDSAAMMKKKRSAIDILKPKLEEFYANGMTNLKSALQKQLAADLCKETGLTYQQVKVC